jgi:hypothetical protein
MALTAEQIEAQHSDSAVMLSQKPKRKVHPNSLKNLKPWKPGQSGHPGGASKDMAKEIARAVFENNPQALYQALTRAVMKGQAFAFQVLADRAYGKLKETKEVEHVYRDVADADLNKRIADLERDLGLARAIDEAGRVGFAAAGAEKTNGEAKDSNVLP